MPSGLPTLLPDTHAGGLGCRARRPLLRSQTISTFYSVLNPDTSGYASGVGRTPLQCVPQPPLAIPTRKDSHLIYVLHSEQVAIRHQPPTQKRTEERTVFRLWHIVYRPFGQRGLFASGALAYFLPPLHRRQLHCVSIHEATSGAVNLSGKGESVKATSPPLCKGSLRCAPLATKRLATHSRTSSPGKYPFRRLTLHSVVVASTPG